MNKFPFEVLYLPPLPLPGGPGPPESDHSLVVMGPVGHFFRVLVPSTFSTRFSTPSKSLLGRFGEPKGTKMDPKLNQKSKKQVGQVARSQKSRWSGLFVLLVLLVSSGLVVWVGQGGRVQLERRPGAPQGVVRGDPPRNDPPCPSRGAKAVPLVPLCLWSLLRLVRFCLPSLWV